MRGLATVLAMALVAVPAYAQPRLDGEVEQNNGPPKEQVGAARALQSRSSEAQYKSALDRIPDQKYDPWGNVRDATPTPPGKKSNKSAPPKL
ncbi:MAG: hypothetical protein JO004_06095 [Methylobacteriaceae bacterium]|nr:hypothetical protein [Methylobacteriaceae bacterium]